jgi:hypothetical protein
MSKGENRMAPRKIYVGPYEARQLGNGRWQVWYVEWTWPTLEQVETDREHNKLSSHPKPESYWEHQRELAKQKEIARPADGNRTYAAYSSAGRRARHLNREWQDAERESERIEAEREQRRQQEAETIESMF